MCGTECWKAPTAATAVAAPPNDKLAKSSMRLEEAVAGAAAAVVDEAVEFPACADESNKKQLK